MNQEIWLPVAERDGYEVSNLGNVRSWHPWRGQPVPRVLRTATHSRGYRTVSLGFGRTRLVHQVVLEAFVGPCPDGHESRHLDGDRTNNTLANLSWGTPSENYADKLRHGNDHQLRKTHCKQGHKFTPENTYRRPSVSGRHCRECGRHYTKGYLARRKAA